MVDKLVPCDIDAEKNVIGSILIDSDCANDIRSIVETDDFFIPECKKIYDAILKIVDRGEPPDQITVARQLSTDHKLDEIGGVSFLSYLVSYVPTSFHAIYYARIVKNLSICRYAISMGNQISNIGYEASEPNEIVSEIEKLVLKIQQKVSLPKLIAPKDLAEKGIDYYTSLRNKNIRGVYTGIYELDRTLGGLFGGEFDVLAGRPGSGKTDLMLTMAEYVSMNFGQVLIASLEMDWKDLLDRYVSQNICTPIKMIRRGHYSDENFGKIVEFMGEMSSRKIFLYDSGGNIDNTGNTTDSIYAIANHMKLAYGLKIVFIDYLGLLSDNQNDKSYERISIISRKLKNLARMLDVPIVCLAQMNREVEHRIPHIPQMSDLRDSGSIEQDADNIFFIYRPEKYEDDVKKLIEDKGYTAESLKGYAELITAKSRQCGELVGSNIGLKWNREKRRYFGEVNRDIMTVPEEFR